MLLVEGGLPEPEVEARRRQTRDGICHLPDEVGRDVFPPPPERTREALVEAARALVRGGAAPTVAEAAEHADSSSASPWRLASFAVFVPTL
jgi:hypothetical protein